MSPLCPFFLTYIWYNGMSGNNDKSHAEMRNATWRGRLPDLLNRLGPPVPEKGHCAYWQRGWKAPYPIMIIKTPPQGVFLAW